MMKCPLCGYQGELEVRTCHGCPLAKNCQKARCCNCGYEFLPESSLSKLVKRILEFWKKKKEGKVNGSSN